MHPLLSVIIPVYNVESYLENCIGSILGQPFQEMEIILIDDGSTDNSGNICDRYACTDPRIRVIHKPNGGLSSARNAGLDIAEGHYITFIDSDDCIEKETYRENMKILLNDPSIDLLEYPVYVHYQSPKQYIWKNKMADVKGNTAVFTYWIHLQNYLHAYAWNKIYKKELFQNIRFPLGKAFEDIYTIPSVLKKVKHLFISEEGMYKYYLRSNTITTTASYKQLRDLCEAHLQLQCFITEYPLPLKEKQIHYLYTANILIDLLDASTQAIKRKETIEYPRPVPTSFSQLMQLEIPRKMKLKNISLVLLGLKNHCLLHHRFHQFTKKL